MKKKVDQSCGRDGVRVQNVPHLLASISAFVYIGARLDVAGGKNGQTVQRSSHFGDVKTKILQPGLE